MLMPYPNKNEKRINTESERQLEKIFDLIGAVRNIRGELRIPANDILDGDVFSIDDASLIRDNADAIQKLGGMKATISQNQLPSPETGVVSLITLGVNTSLKVGESVDLVNELERLKEESSDTDKYIQSINKRLSNEGFTSNAPEDVIQKERDRLEAAIERRNRIEELLEKLL
tara:strand:+ start:24 stop:542 length:519 start_codon:yes stop_codon:yes gene_type:complete